MHALVFGHFLGQLAVLGAVNGKVAAVVESHACLVAKEVDVALAHADILCPCAVKGNGGTLGADKAGDAVVYVVGTVKILGILRPHALIHVARHICAQLAERLARNGLGLGVARAVHDDIEVVHTPVDQCAAARDLLGGKRTAKTGNRTPCAEGDVYVIHLAQLASLNQLADLVDSRIKAVDHADIEHLARLVLRFLHQLCLRIGSCRRLFAKHVLAVLQKVNGNGGVHTVGGTNRNSVQLGIIQNLVVVHDRRAAAVLFHGSLCLFGNDVAEILDLYLGIVHVCGNMCAVCDRTAADHGNSGLAHSVPPWSSCCPYYTAKKGIRQELLCMFILC